MLFSQDNLKVRLTYNVSLKKNEVNSKNKKGQEQYNKIIDNLDIKTYSLDIKNNESMFYDNSKMTVDSKLKLDLISVYMGKGLFYYDKEKNKALHEKNFLGEDFIIEFTPNIKWELTQESKKIGTFICFKAIAFKYITNRIGKKMKRKVVAWYTSNLSINFGIKEFQGLPGLIVLLEEDGLIYKLKKIDLKPKIDFDIKKPTKGKAISKKEYNNLLLNDYSRKF